MKFSRIVPLLGLALSANSSPIDTTADPNTVAAAAKKKYNISFCKAEHYGSCKKYEDLPILQCYDLDKDYNEQVVSIRHSKNFTCYYYRKKDCTGKYLEAPDNYEMLPEKWQNTISSWLCNETPGTPDTGSGGDGKVQN